MEKGWSSSQDQPWSNSFFTSHPVRYPHSRSRHHHRHRRRSFVNSMMKTSRIVFFTIIFVTLWLPPHCLAERIPGNGLEDSGGGGGRELRRVRRGAGGPCLPEEFLAPVRTAFQKIIPTFNSRSLTIQLKTGKFTFKKDEITRFAHVLYFFLINIFLISFFRFKIRTRSSRSRISGFSSILLFNRLQKNKWSEIVSIHINFRQENGVRCNVLIF